MVRRLTSLLLILFLTLAFAAGEVYVSKLLLENVQRLYGDRAKKRMQSWQQLMDTAGTLPEKEKLIRVNQFFNQLRFVNDIDHWRQEDFWATPVEFLASGAGDCEDFSIAKYFTLRELGVSDEKLRITYVKAVRLNQAHMVLSYYDKPGSDPLVLDNLINEIKPASQRNDLKPVYNFNGDGLWIARQRGEGVKVGKADRLKLWLELRERFQTSVNKGIPSPKAGKAR